ncbi:MAG: peptidylprolyl isomerase, partial [Desulfobacteraceae bacterium]
FQLNPAVAEKKVPAKAADINGIAIPYKDFEHQLNMFKQQALRGKVGQLPDALDQRLKTQVIQQMVAEELLFQEATKQGVKADSNEIENRMTSIKNRFRNEKQFQEKLNEAGLTEEKLRNQIRRQTVIAELIKKEIAPQVKVTPQDAKKYYDENPEKFRQPERVRAQHILMKVEKGDSEDKKSEARQKLMKLQKRILAGEDFSNLAREHSQGPSNAKGGDLGYFAKGQMVKPFEEVAFKLAPNEVSDIVETRFGYHLIKVLDHQPESSSPYESVEKKLMSVLFNEQLQEKLKPYVLALREKAKIQVYIK